MAPDRRHLDQAATRPFPQEVVLDAVRATQFRVRGVLRQQDPPPLWRVAVHHALLEGGLGILQQQQPCVQAIAEGAADKQQVATRLDLGTHPGIAVDLATVEGGLPAGPAGDAQGPAVEGWPCRTWAVARCSTSRPANPLPLTSQPSRVARASSMRDTP